MPVKKSLPKSISIFSKTYNIVYVNSLKDVDSDNKKRSSKNTAVFGTVDFRKYEIRVYKKRGYPIQGTLQILLHEIVHCIENELSIDFQNDDPEKIVDNLSVGLFNLLTENDFDLKSLVK